MVLVTALLPKKLEVVGKQRSKGLEAVVAHHSMG